MSNTSISFMEEKAGRIRVFADRQLTLWTSLTDVRRLLGTAEGDSVLAQMEEDDKCFVDGPSGQETFVNEGELHRLIMRSDKPMGIDFAIKMAGEVMPAVMETGRYDMPGIKAARTANEAVANLETVLARLDAPLRFQRIDAPPEVLDGLEARKARSAPTLMLETMMDHFGIPSKFGAAAVVSAKEKQMSDDLIPFVSERFGELRIRIIDGEPWFCGLDVCRALGIKNSRDALSRMDEDEKTLVDNADTLGGPQEMIFVSEPGVYDLIFRSRKPEAKEFKRWVKHDVLPSIRKTKAFALPGAVPADAMLENEDFLDRLAEKLAAKMPLARAKGQAAVLEGTKGGAIGVRPAGPMLLGVLSLAIDRTGARMTRARLMGVLQLDGWLEDRPGWRFGLPSEKALEMGFLEEKQVPRSEWNRFGKEITAKGTLIQATEKGVAYFMEVYGALAGR
jgi:anti-repressor protein